jgi:hypothetical protein
MLCRKVLSLLSEYIDEVLDPDAAIQVFQHLDRCESCRKESESLSTIRQKLRSLPAVQAPQCLRGLIQIRLSVGRKESMIASIRNVLERRWSIIRTTEGIWYWTRALGTVTSAFFFLLICSVVTPYYLIMERPSAELMPRSTDYRNQVVVSTQKKFGMNPVRCPDSRTDPALNGLYFLELGQDVSDNDDNLSVLVTVDPDGAGQIQNVIEYPKNKKLLSRVNAMITTARYRPGSKNGQAVSSKMVIMNTNISVDSFPPSAK